MTILTMTTHHDSTHYDSTHYDSTHYDSTRYSYTRPPRVTLLELFSYRLGWAVCRQSARLNELSQYVASLPTPHHTHRLG